MRILIVGCGYVGMPLGMELVRQGHDVFGLRRRAAAGSELQAGGIIPLFADVTKPAELKKIPVNFDWVVNCVAAGGEAENYRQVYLEGTQNLLTWLAAQPPQKFVYTSSTSVYGQNDGSIVTETSATAPEVATAQILVETENVLRAAARRPQPFPAVILRAAGIYGPERGHWFKQFLKGQAHLEGDGSRYLNMIHRDDLVGCIIAALRAGRSGEIYNAVDDEPVTQLNFFRWLAGVLQKNLPPTMAEKTERRRGVTNKQVSNAKLCAELAYKFQFPNFRAGYTAEIARRKTFDLV
ncbi:MAG TPA: SDR family oxidoreductase [Verrucomicrobiae bacterium]|jgi:nucleoside-diphosphate-sugar epimerase